MNKWSTYGNGKSIGTTTAEGDLILYDEENVDGARITLKRGKEYLSVSINIYGWMDHTRFFTANLDAQREYRAMRSAMETLLKIIRTPDVNKIRVWEAISDFVRRFP
jgi:hypothetical protein